MTTSMTIEEVKQFEESKMGVKGLVDSGITHIPSFFVRPTPTLSDHKRHHTSPDIIPTIDLSGTDVVEQMARASRELGFFQIVNHGVPLELMDRMIASVKAFHEQPKEAKARYFGTDLDLPVSFFSNLDLVRTKSGSWRDTLKVRLGPNPPEVEEMPEMCRNEVMEWNQVCKRLGDILMGLLCEGLGLHTNKLMSGSEKRVMVGHYYPWCPQPDLTMGINSHTDPTLLTILLQDHIGGLQIKHGQTWLDVKPLHGALVINIGGAFQIMSNDEYMSVEHRVLANPFPKPRISIAVCFAQSDEECLYGPFPELISAEKPALFAHFNYMDFISKWLLSKQLNGKSLVDYYRL